MTLELVASDGYPYMPPVAKILERVRPPLLLWVLSHGLHCVHTQMHSKLVPSFPDNCVARRSCPRPLSPLAPESIISKSQRQR